jgi:hypothetical protein
MRTDKVVRAPVLNHHTNVRTALPSVACTHRQDVEKVDLQGCRPGFWPLPFELDELSEEL